MAKATNINRKFSATAVAAVSLATVLLTGCASTQNGASRSPFASLAAMNPFGGGSAEPDPAMAGMDQGGDSSLTNLASGTRNQMSTIGATAKSAYEKTVDGISGMTGGLFAKSSMKDQHGQAIADDDPLRLDRGPKGIGPEVYVAYGQVAETGQNFKQAMESYSKALQVEPNNAPALASIARLHARQNNHVEAVNYFAKASAADPADATILNDYAKSLSKQGQHGAAEAVIQKAIAADPSKSRYSNTLASVKYQMGQKEAALDVLQRANQPAVAHFNMAYLHYNAGAMGDAAKHLQACVACEPTAGDDTTVARAITQSKAMLERLGPAAGTMVANAPAAINAAKQVAGGVQSLTTMAGGTLSQVGAAAQSAARPAQSANYNGPATPPAQRVANLPTNPATTAKIAPVAPVKPMAAAAPTTPIQSAPSAPAATAPAAAQPAPTTSGEAHNFMMPVMR